MGLGFRNNTDEGNKSLLHSITSVESLSGGFSAFRLQHAHGSGFSFFSFQSCTICHECWPGVILVIIQAST